MSKFINVKILRYDPDKDKAPHFQTYKVELRRPGMLLLTVLNQIRWDLTYSFPLTVAHSEKAHYFKRQELLNRILRPVW